MAEKRLIVVGAGAAGCAAALHAAAKGMEVTLIDEHPQPLDAMSLDAPYFYGSRLVPVLSDESLMADRVLFANDAMLECAEAGVDVLTGTCVWGNYVPGENNTHLQSKQLGLADKDKSWVIDYDHLILAPGSRDLVLSFPGWDLPGVLGVNGATTLIERYEALGGSRLVILGSGNAALRAARAALDKGLTVAGIVEVGDAIRGDASLARTVIDAGVPVFCGHTVERAIGETEVTGIRLVAVDGTGSPLPGDPVEIACDTICMAFGIVPNIELAAVAGCAMTFEGSRGGWVPLLDSAMQTSVAGVHVVGDGAGVEESMLVDPELSREQAIKAVEAIAAGSPQCEPQSATTKECAAACDYPPLQWMRSLVAAGGPDVMVCQCEEVSRRELVGLEPPHYLPRCAGNQAPGLASLTPAGQSSQDLLKRLTRVGMGHCQGRRCRDHALMLMSEATGQPFATLKPGSYRAPVRALPLRVMATVSESAEFRDAWPIWLHPVAEEILAQIDGTGSAATESRREKQ